MKKERRLIFLPPSYCASPLFHMTSCPIFHSCLELKVICRIEAVKYHKSTFSTWSLPSVASLDLQSVIQPKTSFDFLSLLFFLSLLKSFAALCYLSALKHFSLTLLKCMFFFLKSLLNWKLYFIVCVHMKIQLKLTESSIEVFEITTR